MKRILSTSVIAVLIGLSAGCGGGSEPAATTGGGNGDTGQVVKACELFTLDDARKVIGPTAEVASNNGKADTRSGDITVTLCGYSDPTGDHFASVLVRSASTENGVKNNDEAFTKARPQGATDVAGYGDKAYFDPGMGQLSVYAEGQYLIFDNGKGLDPAKHSEDEAKQVADLVLPDL